MRLRWNKLTQMYAFDQYQYNEPNHFIDDWQSIFNATDMSVRAVFPKIYQAEVPAFYNFRTNIYLPALDTVFFSNTTLGNRTELEPLVTMPHEILERSSYLQPRIRLNRPEFKDTRIADKRFRRFVEFLIFN